MLVCDKCDRAITCMFCHDLHLHCVVPENIHTHPKDGHWKFQRGGGS